MMNNDETQPTIDIQEHYVYEVSLGLQQVARCIDSWISVDVKIPYLSHLFHRGIKLKDITTNAATLQLGQITLLFPDKIQQRVALLMLAGPDLQTYLKSG